MAYVSIICGVGLAVLAVWLNAKTVDAAGPLLCANGAALLLGIGLASAFGAFDPAVVLPNKASEAGQCAKDYPGPDGGVILYYCDANGLPSGEKSPPKFPVSLPVQ